MFNLKMASGDVLQIDGSVLEGGGQIVRIASTLSCILNRPICISNIRAGRKNPGLTAQHLAGLDLLTDLSTGTSENVAMASTTISLYPQQLEGGCFSKDTKTAGSVCLLIQSALPSLLFSRNQSRLVLKGGTNAAMAPPIDYFMRVLHPMLSKMGVNFNCELVTRGFFPKGGGEVTLSCDPIKSIQPITLIERGSISRITGLSFVAGVLPKMLSDVMKNKSESLMNNYLRKHQPQTDQQQYNNNNNSNRYNNNPNDYHNNNNSRVSVRSIKDTKAFGNGTGIILVAETEFGGQLGCTCIGARGMDPDVVATKVCEQMVKLFDSKACVDDHMQDQLIIFMALASGMSQIRTSAVTTHTKTAIHVVELMTQAKFELTECDDGTTIITCQGCNYVNSHLP